MLGGGEPIIGPVVAAAPAAPTPGVPVGLSNGGIPERWYLFGSKIALEYWAF